MIRSKVGTTDVSFGEMFPENVPTGEKLRLPPEVDTLRAWMKHVYATVFMYEKKKLRVEHVFLCAMRFFTEGKAKLSIAPRSSVHESG